MKSHFLCVAWIVLPLAASMVFGATAQEQSVFNADPSERLARPISVPGAVLEILAKDDTVAACEKDNPVPRGSSLASWFAASEIHLNGSDEADLVILPIAQGNPFMCFHSVEGIGWFWVFRPIGTRYELVLKTAGLGLSVLDSRHNGYRDIQSSGQVGKRSTRIGFGFDGKTYQKYQQELKMMSAAPRL
jgi:hypothetical protein